MSRVERVNGVLARIDDLERRIGLLQGELRELRAEMTGPPARPAPVAPAPTPPAPPPPPPAAQRPRRPARPPRPPAPPRPKVELADLLGARALAWAGGVVTALGVVLFFVLAVNRGWIGPVERVSLGALASLLVFAEWSRAAPPLRTALRDGRCRRRRHRGRLRHPAGGRGALRARPGPRGARDRSRYRRRRHRRRARLAVGDGRRDRPRRRRSRPGLGSARRRPDAARNRVRGRRARRSRGGRDSPPLGRPARGRNRERRAPARVARARRRRGRRSQRRPARDPLLAAPTGHGRGPSRLARRHAPGCAVGLPRRWLGSAGRVKRPRAPQRRDRRAQP